MTDSYLYSQTEPSRNVKVAVGATAVQLCERRLENNPRKVICIRNISPNVADIITIHLGSETAVSENGIVLKQGESFTDSTESGYACWQGQISAICATANGQTAIFER